MNKPTRFAELRREHGLTQQQIAAAVGVSTVTVYRWERSGLKPKTEILPKLAKIFGTSTSYLLGETDDPTPSNAIVSEDGKRVVTHVSAGRDAIVTNGDGGTEPAADEKQDNKPWWPEALAKAYEMGRDDPRLDEAITTIDMIRDVLVRVRAKRADAQSVPA